MLKHFLVSWLKSVDKNVLIKTSFSEILVPSMQFLDTAWSWFSLDNSTASCFWHYSATILPEMLLVLFRVDQIQHSDQFFFLLVHLQTVVLGENKTGGS